METYKEDVESLFASFRDDPEFADVDQSTNFQAWSIELYLGTIHAYNLAAQAED